MNSCCLGSSFAHAKCERAHPTTHSSARRIGIGVLVAPRVCAVWRAGKSGAGGGAQAAAELERQLRSWRAP
eukprot:3510177-Lingulodinium_polyedra.AAC.1